MFKALRYFIFFVFLWWIFIAPVSADSGRVSLSITPPLIKINMNPGEGWSSSVKIVNNNEASTTVYADIVDFKSGEDGGVEFVQGSQNNYQFSLSSWVSVSKDPINLGPYETKEVPFTINVPADGEGGGHYAAILTGTKPPEEKTGGSSIKISSVLASLLMLNVKGDILEEGGIREFFSNKEYYTTNKIKLNLRFKNTGTVHLQPQGEIKIYNMFGKERGVIPINQGSEFGNVLPKSERKWVFDWTAENNFFETGRYRAEVFLSYGDSVKQSASSSIYFWIIDIKTTAIIFGIIFGLLLILFLFIRFNIKRAVRFAQKDLVGITPQRNSADKSYSHISSKMTLNKHEVVDLRRKK